MVRERVGFSNKSVMDMKLKGVCGEAGDLVGTCKEDSLKGWGL